MTSVVVMAGGKGTRIRPLTFSRPKPLVPVANRPMLDYIIQRVIDSGYSKIIMTLGYLKGQISSYVSSRYPDLDFRFSSEKKPLGTAGGVRAAASDIDDTFIVISGDVLFDLDLQQMVRFTERRMQLLPWPSHQLMTLHITA
ncbi:predicted nucleoside-diphosphate-sugar transferase [Methanothermobacter marburgensis str. Marburg]|uniref:Predicted nucleoside-diphosphate-sugar transferase n=1 Tax=Methanothermobacter marburgensis (strain ATCC BAA-927 / DSM 2133 / JCM 14651 / NBRC 100331 / OCM 82 / Marburg) TaxID=79929 RepID=D9PUP0_METTM|nr:nucleotidyltransferase family protein [Methanothermobacter marburgensis]ADL57937.1 predicted nucleoside-diphosphate-sugar transferase [Methanothermobacter marburgensis str. Marburg]